MNDTTETTQTTVTNEIEQEIIEEPEESPTWKRFTEDMVVFFFN